MCGGGDAGKEKSNASLKHKPLFFKMQFCDNFGVQLNAGSAESL